LFFQKIEMVYEYDMPKNNLHIAVIAVVVDPSFRVHLVVLDPLLPNNVATLPDDHRAMDQSGGHIHAVVDSPSWPDASFGVVDREAWSWVNVGQLEEALRDIRPCLRTTMDWEHQDGADEHIVVGHSAVRQASFLQVLLDFVASEPARNRAVRLLLRNWWENCKNDFQIFLLTG
jgi:hypothetical protein